MSSDDGVVPLQEPAVKHTTGAADVSFAKLNPEHHAESSSQAESRSSKGKTSSTSTRRYEENHLSPQDTPTTTSSDKRYHGGTTRRSKKSRGFLLDSVFANGHLRSPVSNNRRGKQREAHERSPASDRNHAMTDGSPRSSQRSSPLARDGSLDVAPKTADRRGFSARPQTQTMDPAQLVQMALSLSESRKRHVSNVPPVPLSPAPDGRRVVSALDSGYSTVRSSHSQGERISGLSGNAGHSSSHRADGDRQVHDSNPDHAGDNVLYTFSPATLSRAEKARRYFELASEHRRLLEHLPPLKTDAAAPGNYTVHATSSTGTAHYDLTRVPSFEDNKHQLGRAYNPLQALRNRRLRNRERRPLTAPPDTWQETDRIKRWVDGVATASKDPSYRPGLDEVHLPTFSGENQEAAQSSHDDTGRRHRRSDTVTSVITRPENGWTIEPAELLADTYWLEKGDNKTVIEDRHGNRLFPGRARLSAEIPRKSRESDRASQVTADKYSQNGDVSGDDQDRSRRKRILPIPTRLRRKHVSRSVSETSVSSDDGRKPPPLRFDNEDGGDENVGPLERHMRNMIAKDENGEMSSPETTSPDHWDSRRSQFPNEQGGRNGNRAGTFQTANGRLSVDTQRHKRSRSAEGRVGSTDPAMSSMDEMVSDSPNSPEVPGLVSMNVPSSRNRPLPSEHRRRKPHIPFLGAKSKERDKVDRTDFAENTGTQLSPVLSADTSSIHGRSSIDSARPKHFKRQKTGESVTSSLRRTDTTGGESAKDSTSFVGRHLLRSGRIGDLVRNESSRFGDRFRGNRERIGEASVPVGTSRAPSDISEAGDDLVGNNDDRADTDSGQQSPRASSEQKRSKQKYHIANLPSFKSPSAAGRHSTAQSPMSEVSDPLAKASRDPRKGLRHAQSAHPALPKINLPDDDSAASDPDPSTSRRTRHDFNQSYERSRSATQNSTSQMPPSVPFSRRPAQGLRGNDNARRHWSISDQAPSQKAHKVTNRDIARVRALLLASGIKAQEIYHHADTVRGTASSLLAKAAQTTGQPLPQVPLKEEHVTAARMLSDSIRSTLSEFDNTLHKFHSETAKTLTSQIEELSHRAGEQLTKIVNETSDEADAFNVELTTKQPQEVKRVDEAVDAMFRQRRRQFRLLRRTGFKLLEWLVLAIMWWVWFCVVMFNTGKKMLVGVFSIIRWILWF